MEKLFFMIQRWQTLYIILGSVFNFFLFSELAIDSDDEPTFWRYIQLLSLVLSLLAICSYTNRKRQINLLYLLVGLLLISIILWFSPLVFKSSILLLSYDFSLLKFLIGTTLSIMFYMLAIKRIKKDDDLIKSIDRIR